MKRLTESDGNGNWWLKGLPWKDMHIGETVTEPTRARLYGALCKLKDYEDTDLAPDEILSGLELAEIYATMEKFKKDAAYWEREAKRLMAATGEEKLKVCERCRNYGSRRYLCAQCSRKEREDYYEPV